ncbi:PLP-dependent aminotransferase family protein [Pelosinus baikalensis]|uniref:PLP-dependent aminotransferase family protein n=1 Tax=Pelosinus baikalensis TaxID=2892015 RepID=A0ABS8HYS9_9FIRM|nr:PLP-dependent aminotransferase family protein [Pelosinus baikalensis]MCC5468320.1 PLP-dependent aminotransferase family protein [Pelosinus baikalensis]
MKNIFLFTPLLGALNKPMYYQLYEYIKNEIILGTTEVGAKLPSLRKMSQYLQLSKNTVEEAYQQLAVEGYIKSLPKIGYVVVDIHSNLWRAETPRKPLVINSYQDSTKYYRHDLAARYVDEACFNMNTWKRTINFILKNGTHALLHLGDRQGEYALRQEIAKYLYENRGVHCQPNQIVVGAGTQYLLSLLCQMMKSRFHSIAMEDPGSNYIRYVFERNDLLVEPVAVHEQGLDVERLTKSKSKIVFVTPSHQFPKGVIMSAANRLQLLNWAQVNSGVIIEDDYDSEMRFAGKPIPALKSLDSNDIVIYLGSFSKFFIPTLRISYMVLPNWLLDSYLQNYQMYEQTTTRLYQLALAQFMREGHLQSHIRKVRKLCLAKYEVIARAIQTHMKGKVNVISGNAGMRVILEVTTSLGEKQLLALAQNAGVNLTPLSRYYSGDRSNKEPGRVNVLVSYKGIPIEDIDLAIKVLSHAWFKD